jgi:RNA-binding protein Tab2/Atab2
MIWELDFYSRPLLDENQKKIWELLICDAQRRFEYVKFCSGAEANARWLQTALEEALPLWRDSCGLTAEVMPEKIRFFRRQMSSIIARGCAEAEIPSQPSRRTFTLYQWLQERADQVYPLHPGFQPLMAPIPELEQQAAQLLPEALVGEGWTFASLEAIAFEEAGDWQMSFGEVFSLLEKGFDPQTKIPGLIIFSTRAIPLAGWMSGLELAFLTLEPERVPQLVLETGVSDRWILVPLRTPQLLAEAEAFEAAKQQSGQVHFLAVQSDPKSEAFAGFWLLQAAELT